MKYVEFSTSDVSEFDCSYITGVRILVLSENTSLIFQLHDVVTSSEPLISGYRLIARYAFGYPSRQGYQPVRFAADLVENVLKLRSILNDWPREEAEVVPPYLALVYPLIPIDTRYRDGVISQNMLVGRDASLVLQLKQACACPESYVCLATLEITRNGNGRDEWPYQGIPDPYKITYALVDISETCGTKLFVSLQLPLSDTEEDIMYDCNNDPLFDSDLLVESRPKLTQKARHKVSNPDTAMNEHD